MKSFILLIVFITANHLCCSQLINMAYIKSFNKIENTQNIDFQRNINSQGKLMTKQEALDYVYSGDTSRLYCIQEIFNMETEKVVGISRVLFLPRKYFLLLFSRRIAISHKAKDLIGILPVFNSRINY
jgi:hypothetical protein